MSTSNRISVFLKQKASIKWILLAVIILAYMCTTFFGDLKATYGLGILLLDCTFDGQFFDFCNQSFADEWRGLGGAVYLVPTYILFAIWNLPCWIISNITGADIFSAGFLFWAKCLVLLAMIGCATLFFRITKEYALEHNDVEIDFWLFAFCSSLVFLITPLFAFYDVIELFFGMWGFLHLSREKTPSVKTLLIFSLAISMKVLMLFPIIIWILLKEKRFLKLLRAACILASVSVVSLLLFIKSYLSNASSFADGMMGRLFNCTIPADLFSISLFAVIYFIACIIAYCVKEPSGISSFIKQGSWLAVLCFFGFILFVNPVHPQWTILVAPFLFFMMLGSPWIRQGFIIESALEITLFTLLSRYYTWVFFNNELLGTFVLGSISPLHLLVRGDAPIATLFDKFGLNGILPGIEALLAVSFVALLFMNVPCDWQKENTASKKLVSSIFSPFEVYSRRFATYRISILVLFLLLTILVPLIV